MATTSKRKLNEALRTAYVERVKALLESEGEEVLVVGSNELAIPCKDAEENEEYIVLTLKVPTGSRDGTPYNGHDEEKDYAFHLKEKARKDKERAEAKAKKIERDRKAREAKAKAKAERGA